MLELVKKLLAALFGGGKLDATVIDLIKSQLINQEGGLKVLIEQLSAKGLGQAVQSWVGTGTNEAINPEHVEQGLGVDRLQELAAKAGLTPDVIKAQLAKLLPRVIDQMTPNGKIPE